MSIDFNQLVSLKTNDQQALLDAVAGAGGTVIKPNLIRCCWHDDNKPSAGTYCKDGHWRYKCHSCGWVGDWFDIVAESRGLHRNEVIKQFVNDKEVKPGMNKPAPQAQAQPQEKEVKTWPSPRQILDWLKTRCEKVKPYRYINPESGKDDLVVFRCEPALDGSRKGFVQATPYNGGFALRGVEGKLPLYNRKGLAESRNAVIAEGEKAADALIGVGICATTAPGGAGKNAADVDWSPLAGKVVYLWPDNDKPGRAWMDRVADEICRIAGAVYMIDPLAFELPEKGDAFDVVASLKANGCEAETIKNAIISELADARSMNPSDEVRQHLQDQIDGKYRAVKTGFELLDTFSKALLPGKVTVICGDPGDGKSFLLLQMAQNWVAAGERVAIYELEDDRVFHLSRVLAQAEQDNRMLDDEWVKDHPDEALEIEAKHADHINRMGRSMWDAPDKVIELSSLVEWVHDRCKEGCRVIAVDPITMTTTSERRFEDDLDFVVRVKLLARQYSASIVLITHPKKGHGKGTGMDDMAGGTAYSRFTHTVIWIKRYESRKEVKTSRRDMMGFKQVDTAMANREILLCKARNGSGAGTKLTFDFEHSKLRFFELGVYEGDAA